MTRFDSARWQARFDELRAAYHVPGSALSVLVDGELQELASGVLHRGRGVEVTTDSVFQSGSIAKTYTATLVMQLVDAGELSLQARVAEVLPDFALADPSAAASVTVRQLLRHSSGIAADFTRDTGRGDDCLARYVDACAEVGLDCPPDSLVSYCSTGYNLLGRIVEVLTGQVWDEALKERLFEPLGLEHSMTLPEEALRFRVAMGHVGELGQDPDPAPVWDALPRSAGPYGRVLVTAADMVRFARMHLAGGVAPDGTRLLTAETVVAMRHKEVDTPDRWTFGTDGWGLGWALYDWGGVHAFGHDGSAVSQHAFLRAVPAHDVAVALLTNGGGAAQLSVALLQELLGELTGARVPDSLAPPPVPPRVDADPLVGTYRREGMDLTVTACGGAARLRVELTGGMSGFSPPLELDLLPVQENVFAAPGGGVINSEWLPIVFAALPDGTPCACFGMRVAPRIA